MDDDWTMGEDAWIFFRSHGNMSSRGRRRHASDTFADSNVTVEVRLYEACGLAHNVTASASNWGEIWVLGSGRADGKIGRAHV